MVVVPSAEVGTVPVDIQAEAVVADIRVEAAVVDTLAALDTLAVLDNLPVHFLTDHQLDNLDSSVDWLGVVLSREVEHLPFCTTKQNRILK